MFKKVLIANRGEIARRIIKTLDKMGIASAALYSDADRGAPHVREAGEAHALGGTLPAENYLRHERVLEIARESGAQAIHPGYGFLSENADFAQACESAGIAFIGPTPDQIRRFGLKHEARDLAEKSRVPLLPGTGLLESVDEAVERARAVGYPVMLKSTAGGGGIGMRLCGDDDSVRKEFQTVRELGRSNFAADGIFLERYIERARHIEVQIFGDGAGRVLALGDRDCSVQRRNQKVIEETPAPGISDALRESLFAASVRLGESLKYRSAGTVEFVYDVARQEPYFLEVNTRLQVEHGVTENVTGIDLVEWMVRLAAGESDFIQSYQAPRDRKFSIQARVYAEDPARDFRPDSGRLDLVSFPEDVRVDGWIESGTEVSPYYDPMLAKVMAAADSREAAINRLHQALGETRILGIETNLDYLSEIIDSPNFRAGDVWTRMLGDFSYQANRVEVLSPGMLTAVQDYPGRVGGWRVGVPPSGPMDAYALRLGNRLLGNDESTPGLEMTVLGPTLKFHAPARICLTGARMQAALNGPDGSREVTWWETLEVSPGDVLKLGAVEGHGARAYLSVAGGFDVAKFQGSAATFDLGGFGGHAGRVLQVGDMLRLARDGMQSVGTPVQSAPGELVPEYGESWTIAVLSGPHGAPEFFKPEYIEEFFATDWEVHYNSARTGVRLTGPRPGWTRTDGGEAGLHPSNIHDNAYAVGTIDFTGDMPIILGPDGPSLGGFVCPATVIRADLWKVGQLKPGDKIRFARVSLETAVQREAEQNRALRELTPTPAVHAAPAHVGFATHADDAILGRVEGDDTRPEVCYRQAGDKYLLVEYGPIILDFALRMRVHALMERLERENAPGIIEMTPGIRSLQIHYDGSRMTQAGLVDLLRRSEGELPGVDDMSVQGRIVHLPLSFDDPSTRKAIEIYQKSVWADAPWCPSNLEFIRRINGLDSIDQVREIVFAAEYMVLGLGDVYLGAPVATPVDPRHRLVTTKYNPARTWTPQNAVGIGGAYLCVYGMEGPGGYQFVGRTCQVWSSFQKGDCFIEEPYLLRFFDRIRFYPVSPEELLDFRRDFEHGRAELRMEPSEFRLADYRRFLENEKESIAAFKTKQQQAFDAERERWKDLPPPEIKDTPMAAAGGGATPPPAGSESIDAPLRANVWKILVEPGARVAEGETILILEAMKMEVEVKAPADGVLSEILVESGAPAAPGQRLALLARADAS